MAANDCFMTALLVLLISILHNNYVLCDDDCGSSGEVDSPFSLTDCRVDSNFSLTYCKNQLDLCCLGRQSNPTSLPNTTSTSVCAFLPCSGWRGVFSDWCEWLHYKCKLEYNSHYNEYLKGTTEYWSHGCNCSDVNIFKDMLECPGIDKKPPVFSSVPRTRKRKTDTGKPTAVVWWQPPYVSDESGHVTRTSNWQPGDAFPIGITKVVYQAVDASGNWAEVSFRVKVEDKENPVITSGLPSVIHLQVQPGQTSRRVTWPSPIISDNSGIVVLINQTKHSGDVFPIGITKVMYHAEDPYDNSADFSFVVLITSNDPPSPRQKCSCDIAPSISYCQLGVESPAQTMVRCRDGSKYFSSRSRSTVTGCRCSQEPPGFPACVFPTATIAVS